MNYSTCSRDLDVRISLLIPFSTTDPYRLANFEWLLKYWKKEMPDAEIIIGESRGKIFSKGEALNDAVSKSTGNVLVILDADAYLYGEGIYHCAKRIREEVNNNLWYVPYRRLYRLTREVSAKIISSDPGNPYRVPLPVSSDNIENMNTTTYGHRYGAMLMMFPREAYDFIGGFDERFKGWGGEDVCFLRALNTVYGKYKTYDGDICHIWHPTFGNTYETRKWQGQDSGGSNWNISKRYGRANGNPSMMWELINESIYLRLNK